MLYWVYKIRFIVYYAWEPLTPTSADFTTLSLSLYLSFFFSIGIAFAPLKKSFFI